MSNCPCGLEKDYSQCCEPFHAGSSYAPTAEMLMRSRYSAFVKNEIDYIMDTFSEASKGDVKREDIQSWAEQSTWKGLEIIKTENGLENDDNGIVEFRANYEAAGQKVSHHEKSYFEKTDGKWFFVDGQVVQDTVRREGPKVGRNDPCPCGSGKKYKKCCLNA